MTPPPPKPLSPAAYWGYLISPDHPTQPTPLFRNLLLGIANYIIGNLGPRDVRCLTPEKIASFYHAVGGDLDDLFLNTPPAKLSSIYMTLGCSHSLQPTPNDDFVPPSIPALTSRGFVIWQTIQLLLDPEEHVPYLQQAARIFPLVNPETNQPFPREIPKEAFPANPDGETVRWHDEMFAKQSAKEAAAEKKKDPSKHGKVQVPVPGEHVEPGYTEYHRHHHHHAPPYAEPYVSRSRRSRRHAAPAPAPEPPVEDERYSRSMPGEAVGDPFIHHQQRRHSQHPPEPVFNSDSEGRHHSHHSRHHSRRGTREREFSKPYVYENGVVTPIVPVFPATVLDLGDGVHIIADQIPSSPSLPANSHFRHAHNYQAPTVTAPEPLSNSSSYSDLNGQYHSHHHSPQHLSHTHRDHSRPRSSSPLRPAEPPLRKSQSAYYYAQDPPVHTHSNSRSRSGGSGRRIQREISDMDSDVSDNVMPASTWTLQAERFRAEEEAAAVERENMRRRGQSKDGIDRRHRRPVNPERTENWEYSGGGGGGGGGGGRIAGGKRYYRGFNPVGPMEGMRGAYFY